MLSSVWYGVGGLFLGGAVMLLLLSILKVGADYEKRGTQPTEVGWYWFIHDKDKSVEVVMVTEDFNGKWVMRVGATPWYRIGATKNLFCMNPDMPKGMYFGPLLSPIAEAQNGKTVDCG